MKRDPEINRRLRDHQVESEDWRFHELAETLHTWAERLNRHFRLNVGTPAVCLEALPRTRYGHFRYGRNAFGLEDEIAVNTRYLDRPLWRIIGTLFHEQLHQWQQRHGNPGRRNYHNREFREKAALFGLIVDHRGATEYDPGGRFVTFLGQNGVDVSDQAPRVLEEPDEPGRTKLLKWTCGCTNVRVAIADFEARCLKCGNIFKPES